eukprot:jgi/Hompol1/6707/HPOL_001638-RA
MYIKHLVPYFNVRRLTDTEASEEVKQLRSSKLASTIAKLLAPQPAVDEKTAKKLETRPILSKKRKIEKDIDDAKLEAKALKVLTANKKVKQEKGRVIPDHTTTDYEKQLRRLATRGVVQLFNAIRTAQNTTKQLVSDGIQKHVAKAPEVTKDSFIKALKEESGIAKSKTSVPAKAATKNESNTAKQEGTRHGSDAVPWMAGDFAMKAPKHWDQDDEEEAQEETI